jgi:hypothetical protein
MNAAHPADVPETTDKPRRSKITKIGGCVIWTAILLFLLLTNPVFGQLLLSPQLEVYDSSGHYSGQTPLVKTMSLLEVEECSDVQRTYHNPTHKRIQVLKKLDLVNINVMHCKLALDYTVSYCGWDGAIHMLTVTRM